MYVHDFYELLSSEAIFISATLEKKRYAESPGERQFKYHARGHNHEGR